jgi:hypothetical protein
VAPAALELPLDLNGHWQVSHSGRGCGMEESLTPSKRETHPPSGGAASPQIFYPLWPHEHRWASDPEGNVDGRRLLMIGSDWNLLQAFDWPAHSAIILHQDDILLSYKQNYLLHCHGRKLFFDHPECMAARGPAARTWAATSCTKMTRMMMGSWSIWDHMWEPAFITANVLVNRNSKDNRYPPVLTPARGEEQTRRFTPSERTAPYASPTCMTHIFTIPWTRPVRIS